MRRGWNSIELVSIAVFAATMAAYSSVISCDFISYDDPGYVYQNSHVLQGLTYAGWRWAWTTFHCSNWHPLTWLSLQLDGSFWGAKPVGYHITNAVLHGVNSSLLFVVLHQMTSSIYRSAFVAALFGLHPLHVESVAWISERKDVLSTFFLLLTISNYVGYAARPSFLRYMSVLLFFIMGLLAKPMLVTVPLLLMLLDFWPLRRAERQPLTCEEERFPRQSLRKLLLEKTPLLLLSLIDGVVTIVAQRDAARSIHFLPIDTRIANSFHALGWYLQKTFAPFDLTVFYPHPEGTLTWIAVGKGSLIFCIVTTWVFWRRKTAAYLLVGWTWFVVSLAPVIGLLQVGSQAYADRYAYIPHIGLFTAIVWEFCAWFRATATRRAVGTIIAVSILFAVGFLTHTQLQYWKNSTALWNHSLEVIRESSLAHAHLGDILVAAGDYSAAIDHIERSLRSKRPNDRNPLIANAYFNWGRSLVALNRESEAEAQFRSALKIDADHLVALDELARLLRRQGRENEAAEVAILHATASIRKAEQKPNDLTAQLNVGLVFARQGNFPEAAKYFEKAVQIAPDSADACNNLGRVNADLKRFKDAKLYLSRAIKLNPKLAVAYRTLGEVHIAEQDFAAAKRTIAEAVRLNPSDAVARQQLDQLRNQ